MSEGERIEMYAMINGLNLKELADLSGISYSTIYNAVNRKSNRIAEERLQKLAAALHVTVDDLKGIDRSQASYIDSSKKEIFLERLQECYRNVNQADFLDSGLYEIYGRAIDAPELLTGSDITGLARGFGVSAFWLLGLTASEDPGNYKQGSYSTGAEVLPQALGGLYQKEINEALKELQAVTLDICRDSSGLSDLQKIQENEVMADRIRQLSQFLQANKPFLKMALISQK